MNNWRHAGWKGFLSNRILLYEICELCGEFPQAGTPTQATQLDRYFSDWVCHEIDKGLALWRKWYTSRANERVKSGKYSTKPKYPDLEGILGITLARQMGWMTVEGEATVADMSSDYKEAAMAAIRSGQPVPDIVEFVERREWGIEDNAQNEDAEWQ